MPILFTCFKLKTTTECPKKLITSLSDKTNSYYFAFMYVNFNFFFLTTLRVCTHKDHSGIFYEKNNNNADIKFGLIKRSLLFYLKKTLALI